MIKTIIHIILLLSTLVNTLGTKTIKLIVEYLNKNHDCYNELRKIHDISSLIENIKKEGYYYTYHETTAITNSVKVIPTRHYKIQLISCVSLLYYNYI